MSTTRPRTLPPGVPCSVLYLNFLPLHSMVGVRVAVPGYGPTHDPDRRVQWYFSRRLDGWSASAYGPTQTLTGAINGISRDGRLDPDRHDQWYLSRRLECQCVGARLDPDRRDQWYLSGPSGRDGGTTVHACTHASPEWPHPSDHHKLSSPAWLDTCSHVRRSTTLAANATLFLPPCVWLAGVRQLLDDDAPFLHLTTVSSIAEYELRA